MTKATETPLLYSFNSNVAATSAPPIPLASLWASKYKSSQPLINLSQGVPHQPPPEEFLKRLSESSAQTSTTKYGDLRGDLGLREALIGDVNTVYGGDIEVQECFISSGCNLAFYSVMVTLAKSGDEIILPSPHYFNHEMTLTQLGIKTVSLPCSPPSFLPSISVCRKLITPKTKAIVLVTPFNNPTGATYLPQLIEEFASLAREYRIALILDETYREFMVERPHELFNNKGKGKEEDWRGYLIHLFSFSKSFAIPGHRLGAIITSSLLLDQVSKTLDCLQICPARPAQEVVEWAIEGTRIRREGIRNELILRGEMFKSIMKEAKGWEVETIGGYFAYVKHPFPGQTSEKVASLLAQYVGIVVLPGSFFNPPFLDIQDDRYLRFSVANVESNLLALVPERLTRFVEMWDSILSSENTNLKDC